MGNKSRIFEIELEPKVMRFHPFGLSPVPEHPHHTFRLNVKLSAFDVKNLDNKKISINNYLPNLESECVLRYLMFMLNLNK